MSDELQSTRREGVYAKLAPMAACALRPGARKGAVGLARRVVDQGRPGVPFASNRSPVGGRQADARDPTK
jgi:hypothetical protein